MASTLRCSCYLAEAGAPAATEIAAFSSSDLAPAPIADVGSGCRVKVPGYALLGRWIPDGEVAAGRQTLSSPSSELIYQDS
jgi:hypothetical protein